MWLWIAVPAFVLVLLARRRRRKGKRDVSTDALTDVLGLLPARERWRPKVKGDRWWL